MPEGTSLEVMGAWAALKAGEGIFGAFLVVCFVFGVAVAWGAFASDVGIGGAFLIDDFLWSGMGGAFLVGLLIVPSLKLFFAS